MQSLSSLYLPKEKPKRKWEVAHIPVLANKRMGFFTILVQWLWRVQQRLYDCSGIFHAKHLSNPEYRAVPSGLQCAEFSALDTWVQSLHDCGGIFRAKYLSTPAPPGLKRNFPVVLLGFSQELLEGSGTHMLRDQDHLKIMHTSMISFTYKS
jgi:hypothetical protein